jgi:heme exporter protein CcmD
LQDFLYMSGYGPYVWSCFLLTFAVLIYNAWQARTTLGEEIVKAQRRARTQTGSDT